MSLNLNGKVALVTGASTGIGAEIARALGACGAAVVVNYRSDRTGADAVVATIVAAGGRAVAVAGDVGNAADAAALVAAAIAHFGTLEVVVNNAGVFEFLPIESFVPDHYERQFRANVLGPMLVTAAAVPHLRDGASIINIGSSVTHFAPPGASVYAASKGAVDAFTRVLANELGPRGIRVNTLKPGLTATERTLADGSTESAFVQSYVERTPLRRLGSTADVARVAVFLASDDAGFITGEHLFASGGLR
ncbi:SDR family oxidoreductase [Stenotrophomonas sp. 24(2023)]|uniref:SDR family NAD(P)-dependent oxidoreductase n=1 Tax=Stenotrophomonas sp. 24(2023) TaxID=3068324 RepID=UPI0027E047CB|nr:SDR family oxidoreductase [Stenotrophomonas sp. 24(2023)]WMJ68226.1 SDR family oxidoreductase [Stenotrophomonas sp. 24(2023)]